LDDDDQETERVVLETLPTGVGRRNRQVFELARTLKSIPLLADAPADDLQCYVRYWHRCGVERGVIGTEPFEETWIDFLQAWPKVKFPKGAEPMMVIFQRAQRGSPCEAASQYEQDELRVLVALCRELQRASGDHPFFLGCRTAPPSTPHGLALPKSPDYQSLPWRQRGSPSQASENQETKK